MEEARRHIVESGGIFIDDDGQWYVVPIDGHNFMSGYVNFGYGKNLSDYQLFNARLYGNMHKALGAFDRRHWAEGAEGLPELNDYDLSVEDGCSADLVRQILGVADSIPSYFNRSHSAKVRALLIPECLKNNMRMWMAEVEPHGLGLEESVSTGNWNLFGMKIAVETEMPSFCNDPDRIWVILDGPVGRAKLNHDGDDWHVRILEEHRHNFFRVKCK